jgi:uncharacterized MnhB-related membrane protein
MEIKPEGLDRPGEQAEQRLDPYDRQVAMTMAIIAAVLASVTMLSHRAHDDSLSLLAEANRLTTAANIHHTEASDQWGYYQAKNNRASELEASLALLSVLGKAPGADAQSAETVKTWTGEIKKYRDTELPTLKVKAEALAKEGRELEFKSEGKTVESYEARRRGDRLDLAELAIELALVLCSIAVLTKQPSFWYAGIASGIVGAIIAFSAFA